MYIATYAFFFLFITFHRTWGKQFVVQECLLSPYPLITSDHTRLVVHYISRFVFYFSRWVIISPDDDIHQFNRDRDTRQHFLFFSFLSE